MLIFDKKKLNKNLVVLCLMALGITACSSTDDIDEFEPAELVEITQQFETNVLWEENIGGGADDFFSRLSPTVAYDKLFTGSREGDVAALNLETGETLWSTDLRVEREGQGFFERNKPAQLSGGPIAGINKVFIGSENGKIYALDVETGHLDWEANIKGEVLAAPAIDSGILAVNTASGVLKAFNATNGEELWKIEQDTPALTLRGISAPAISSGGVFVGTPDGNLTVYIVDNGQQGWSAMVGEPSGSTEFERVIDVDSSPVVFGDRAYSISSRGNLVAVDLRSGQIVWKRQYSSHTDLLVSSNNIYLTDIKGHVYALDRLNGTEKWSQLALTHREVTGPAEVGEYIVVGDFEGYLHWLNSETGEIVSRQKVDSSGIHTTPTVNGDVIYTQARNGDIQAIQAP